MQWASLPQSTLSLSGNALSLRQRSLSQSTLSLSVNALSLRRTFSDSKSVLVKGLRGALDTLLHKLVPFPLDVIAWTAPRAIAAGPLPNASRLEATVRGGHIVIFVVVDDVYAQHINAHVCAAMDGCEGGMIGGEREEKRTCSANTTPRPAPQEAQRPGHL